MTTGHGTAQYAPRGRRQEATFGMLSASSTVSLLRPRYWDGIYPTHLSHQVGPLTQSRTCQSLPLRFPSSHPKVTKDSRPPADSPQTKRLDGDLFLSRRLLTSAGGRARARRSDFPVPRVGLAVSCTPPPPPQPCVRDGGSTSPWTGESQKANWSCGCGEHSLCREAAVLLTSKTRVREAGSGHFDRVDIGQVSMLMESLRILSGYFLRSRTLASAMTRFLPTSHVRPQSVCRNKMPNCRRSSRALCS